MELLDVPYITVTEHQWIVLIRKVQLIRNLDIFGERTKQCIGWLQTMYVHWTNPLKFIFAMGKTPIAHQWQHPQYCYSTSPVCSQTLSHRLQYLYSAQELGWQNHPPLELCTVPLHTVLSQLKGQVKAKMCTYVYAVHKNKKQRRLKLLLLMQTMCQLKYILII